METSFESVDAAKQYIKQFKDVKDIHGNSDFVYDFIHRNFKGEQHAAISDLTVLSLDIETTVGAALVHGGKNFPDVFDPYDEVLLITTQDINKGTLTTFGSRPYSGTDTNYILCKDEADLLTKFIDFIIDTDPDIITGWNVIKFDIAYLGSRIIKVLGQRVWNRISPFNNVERKIDTILDQETLSYIIQGRTVLDLLELYKKFRFINRPNYKLGYIAQVELGETKLEYAGSFKDQYTNNWDGSVAEAGFVAYNIQDVILVSKLEKKLGLVYLAVTLAYLAKINFDDVFSPVRTWESHILSTLYEENIFCKLKQSSKTDHQIVGGYVKDPTPGLYKWTATFDGNSLYPSIIRSLNMSPETLVGQIPDINSDLLLSGHKLDDVGDYAIAANGVYFSRTSQGIMPRLTESMFGKRKSAKDEMIRLKKLYESTHEVKYKDESARFGVLQLAVKVCLNSLFGCSSSPYFMFFDNRIAEGITMTGQYVIQRIQNEANDHMKRLMKKDRDYIVYSDTDSCLGSSLVYVNDEQIPIEKLYDMFSDYTKYDVEKQNFVKPTIGVTTKSFNTEKEQIETKQIKYVMKHTVKKEMFRISSEDGNSVVVTCDHSVIVRRNNVYISIKPKDIVEDDIILNINTSTIGVTINVPT